MVCMLFKNIAFHFQFFILVFLELGFLPCKTEHPLQSAELQEKEAQKILKHTGNLLRKNLQLKGVCSRLKTT